MLNPPLSPVSFNQSKQQVEPFLKKEEELQAVLAVTAKARRSRGRIFITIVCKKKSALSLLTNHCCQGTSTVLPLIGLQYWNLSYVSHKDLVLCPCSSCTLPRAEAGMTLPMATIDFFPSPSLLRKESCIQWNWAQWLFSRLSAPHLLITDSFPAAISTHQPQLFLSLPPMTSSESRLFPQRPSL